MQLLLRELLLAAPSPKQWQLLDVLLEVRGKGAAGTCAVGAGLGGHRRLEAEVRAGGPGG